MNTKQRIDNLTLNRSGFQEKCRPGLNNKLIYGLEYVAADYSKEYIKRDVSENSIDWYGLFDLTID